MPLTRRSKPARKKNQLPLRNPLAVENIKNLDAYRWVVNYLSVGRIYLDDHRLLKQPLNKDQIKPRLLGYWGIAARINFNNIHLNRVIRKYYLDMIHIARPGHGAPGLVANSDSEVYPNISQNEEKVKKLFKQFFFESIHEGNEPNVVMACYVEDVIDRMPRLVARTAEVKQSIRDKRIEHKQRLQRNGEDMPEISQWRWGDRTPGLGGSRTGTTTVYCPSDAGSRA